MNRSRILFTVFLATAYTVLFAGVVIGASRHMLYRPSTTEEPVYLYIKQGDGLLRVASALAEQQLSQRMWHAVVGAKILGHERQLKAGEYEITAGSTLAATLHKIASGDNLLRRVSVPEGFSAKKLEQVLSESFGLDMTDYTSPPEGSILPETYFYSRGESAAELVKRMQRSMQEKLQTAWQSRQDELPLSSPEDAVILASIVEKETGVEAERPIVAAVFINRLRAGMRLQSDPTVIYGITGGLPLKRALSRTDLKTETPYNTYKIKGLPIGPIANPGIQSIEAVLNPAEVPYLYFVADGTGGHVFARTLQEHNANVRDWRKIQKSAYQ